jgi:hypothetical protein
MKNRPANWEKDHDAAAEYPFTLLGSALRHAYGVTSDFQRVASTIQSAAACS